MKLKRIISVIFILLILFTNSLVAFAEETEEDDHQTVYINEQYGSETDITTTNYVGVDTSNYNGYVKPSTEVYDDANGYLYQDEYFASYYFKGLENNFGYNTHGSCGYVATAMMLSYYDTYLDDNIISEQYDKEGFVNSSLDLSNTNNESPGIEREVNSLCPTNSGVSKLKDLDSEHYWKVVENHWRIYFHLYLIKLAEEEFNMYHDTLGVLEEGGIQVPIDSDNPCASAMLHQKSLMEYYLYNVKNYTPSDVSIEYANTDVRNFAINKIKNGQPVMLLLGGLSGFHFVVAYDLDDKETANNSDDDIYAHYGWKTVQDIDGNIKDAMHLNIDTDEFDLLVSAMAINFNVEHSHAYNYKDSLGNTYCSCYFPVHPEHVCSYTDHNDFSTYQCGCSANGVGSTYHILNHTNLGDSGHTVECDFCGYVSNEGHSLQYSSNSSDLTHIASCTKCDYTTTTSHNYRCYGTMGTFHSEACIDCGYAHMGLANVPYTSVDANSHSKTCPDCGYTKSGEHNKSYENISDSNHKEYCTECDYVNSAISHDYTNDYEYYNTTQHTSYCVCGAFVLRNHTYQIITEGQLKLDACIYCVGERNHEHSYTYTPCNDGKTHHTSCGCGISNYEQCFGIAGEGVLPRCLKCNQRLSGNIIIPLEDDDDDENDVMFFKEDGIEEETE